MTTPAVVFAGAAKSDHSVAGVSVLDRLVVALDRGGCGPIMLVGAGGRPELERSAALGIRPRVVAEAGDAGAPVLVATSDVLVTEEDVRSVLAARGRLVTRSGEALPVGVTEDVSAPVMAAIGGAPPVRSTGLSELVDTPAKAKEAERALWASLTSAGDGLVDRFLNRPLSRVLSSILARTRVAPNHVTFISVVVGLVAAAFLARGTRTGFIWGALLFQLSAVIDCVDGDLARATFRQSRLGKWLDIIGDQVVHLAVFTAIAAGVGKTDSDAPAFWLGVSVALGVVLCFAVVLRGKRLSRSPDRLFLDRLTDSVLNRDFSVILLALALVDRVGLFLWAAAVFIHLYWIMLLIAQRGASGRHPGGIAGWAPPSGGNRKESGR